MGVRGGYCEKFADMMPAKKGWGRGRDDGGEKWKEKILTANVLANSFSKEPRVRGLPLLEKIAYFSTIISLTSYEKFSFKSQ